MPSLPSWERGLKLSRNTRMNRSMSVAPLVGAWIEILPVKKEAILQVVAPLVGAWIEILLGAVVSGAAAVAPLVGAWIEIFSTAFSNDILVSLPSWERGLKSVLAV